MSTVTSRTGKGRWLLLPMVAALALVASCASSGSTSVSGRESAATTEQTRKTEQQVQVNLMSFADRFFAGTLDAADKFEQSLQTPEGRYDAAAERLGALLVTADIAAGPNPGGALLDMTAFVTLKRTVWEEYWVPEVYGEDGWVMLDAYRALEADIWKIAAGVYTPEQLEELRQVIGDWRAANPDQVQVDFIRLSVFGDSRQVETLLDAGRPGGMLAPVREANRNIEEMRLLAERLVFMITRMQLLVNLQVDMASAKLVVRPEIRQLLEDSHMFAEVADRVAETFAALAADLPAERRAAIDQILDGLGQERERIFADLGAENGDLRPFLRDARQTLEVGRDLAAVLGETIRATDALVARAQLGDKEAARPFNILEYQATLAEAAVTVREIQAMLTSFERVLESTGFEDHLPALLSGANQLEDEVVNEIVDRAFLRGVALIFVFFVVLTVYRWLIPRVAPGLAPKRNADK
jgi:hypothetical protein